MAAPKILLPLAAALVLVALIQGRANVVLAPRTSLADPPVRIHLWLAGKDYDVGVTWDTNATTTTSVVYWGVSAFQLTESANGTQVTWEDGGNLRTNRTTHNAQMSGLAPNTEYYYMVGDEEAGMSDVYSFRTLSNGDQVVTMAVYGDMGETNSRSLSLIAKEVAADDLDLILHVGDFAYDLDTDNGYNGDYYMQGLQPIATHVPYVTAVGNHEFAYNFTHYTNRWSGYAAAAANSGSRTNWWYSWDYYSGGARIHMVSVSSEIYYYWFFFGLLDFIDVQYEWLAADLAANQDADWIIVYGHRPMYCSNTDDIPDCTSDAQNLREGLQVNGTRRWGLDKLMHEGKVDIYFTAHEHSYERTFPVYDSYYQPQDNHTYVNPNATVHIVTGAAGCPENLDYFAPVQQHPWSVVRSSTYGFGHLIVYNSTHLYWEQLLSEGAGGKDPLWIIKQ